MGMLVDNVYFTHLGIGYALESATLGLSIKST